MSEDQNLFFVDKKRKRDVDIKDEVKPVNTEGKKKKKFISGFVSEEDDDEDKLVPTKEENDLAALLFGNTKISNGGRASIPMPPQLQTKSKLVENEEEEEFSDNASEKEESKEGSEDESFEEENKLNCIIFSLLSFFRSFVLFLTLFLFLLSHQISLSFVPFSNTFLLLSAPFLVFLHFFPVHILDYC